MGKIAEWRFGHGWSAQELQTRLRDLRSAPLNFEPTLARVPSGSGWRRYFTQAIIGLEAPGRPERDGAFTKAWNAIRAYEFSDPSIVRAFYDPSDPLLGRTMLLEIRVLGLRYLCGTRVGFERDRSSAEHTTLGYRYDTLEGHFEAGSEWFLLSKNHNTGEIRFRIHASWKMAEFPNWWSRAGFKCVGQHYQLAWHRMAYLRLRQFLGSGKFNLKPVPSGPDLVHSGADAATDRWLWIPPETGEIHEKISRIERNSPRHRGRSRQRNQKHGRATKSSRR